MTSRKRTRSSKTISSLIENAPTIELESPAKRYRLPEEWSVVAYHQLNVGADSRHAQTREGKIKDYKTARLWALNFIRTTTMVSLVEVCHVEKNDKGQFEDVPVHRFFNSMGVWKQSIRKKPWFYGTQH